MTKRSADLVGKPLSKYQSALLDTLKACYPGGASDRILRITARRFDNGSEVWQIRSSISRIQAKRPNIKIMKEKLINGYRLGTEPGQC